MGDMQEHRYPYQRAWRQNGWHYNETEHVEHVGNIVYHYYDPARGRFMNPLELEGERMRKEEIEQQEAMKRPPFVVPDSVMDDWTGSKFLNNWWCYGHDPCPPRESKL